jgi:hypothetical protein
MASSQDAPVAELAQLQLAVRKTEAELRELREAEDNATKLAVEAEKVRLRNTAREELKKMHDILAVSQLPAERSGMTVQEYFPELQAMELKVKTRELVIVLNYLYETDPEFAYSLIHCVASTQSSDATCAGSEQRGEVPLMHSLLEAMNPDLFAFLVNDICCVPPHPLDDASAPAFIEGQAADLGTTTSASLIIANGSPHGAGGGAAAGRGCVLPGRRHTRRRG